MSYFTQDFLTFFSELESNNNREWFLENKKRYEESVKKPFEYFVQDMIYRIHEDDENMTCTTKEAIFRIYRDVRFSPDKTPYKTHVSAVIGNGGRKNYTDPGTYLELSSKQLRFYSGIYQLSKDQLEKVRVFLSSNLDEFNGLLNDKNFKKYFGSIRGEQNKRISSEFTNALAKQPLLANKQFYYFTELEPKKILTKNLPESLMTFYFAAKPMNKFLKKALG
ncbi:MAG: DUF2461 domain-containing protein [Melioribacteraceae bacterium]|nr:DUF2461 domain-containing protein [Melioribacteraceae bacterium]